jgi:ribonuclease PH
MTKRNDGRAWNEIRPINIIRNYLNDPEGSVLIEMGNTKVICTVSVNYKLPAFIREEGLSIGWVTAEYDMLPRSTSKRILRDRLSGQIRGRSQEIQRLIGRCLRTVTDLTAIPERTIYVDCDVIQADGGTRTAAINGSFVALYDAFVKMKEKNQIDKMPVSSLLGAISLGIIDGELLLDLTYREDSAASVDMNIVKNDEGKYIEIQGTAEGHPFSDEQLIDMLKLADKGIQEIISFEKKILFSNSEEKQDNEQKY